MKSSSRSSKSKTKRSQKHTKKRTKSSREKPKKLKQRDDSDSISDEDSITTKSVSCSSPGDYSRSKKRGRSRDKRLRKDKKRSKKSTLLSESSGDDSPCVKKSKKLKRKRGSDSRKKRHVKRRKRDRSVSISSSRSRSCSVGKPSGDSEIGKKEEKVESKERKGREKVRKKIGSKRSRRRSRSCSVGEPSGDSEREFGKMEEKVESKERKGREKDRKKSGIKKSRRRSRSCSPCSVHSESSSHYSEERVFEKSNPNRLKSVIVVMKDREEVPEKQESNKYDRHEDEIVFEYDDYPSKSNDSIDGVSGRETVSCMHDVSSKKRSLDEPNKDFVASGVRTSDIPGIQRQVVEGSGGLSPSYVRSRDNVPLMENRSANLTSNAGLNHVDLEAVLRQKALENLLNRQGKLSTKTTFDKKDEHDVDVKRSSIVKAQPIDQPTPRDEGNIKLLPKVGKIVNDVRYFSNTTNLPGPSEDTGLSKYNNADLLRAKVGTADTEEKSKASGDFVNSRPNVGLSMSRKDFLGAKNTWKQQLIPQESSQEIVSTPKETIVRNSNEKLMSLDNSLPKLSVPQKTISKDSTRDCASHLFDSEDSTIKVDTFALSEASASASVSDEQCTNDSTNKADEDAQFQQKTMSVMRGGEMVQVSYKVYIPKKAPALARRQLKR
ncbi:dentin sialophosphoprotein-like [Chenopodium quinoa]|uniref:dentin sialophosphoprotein-like n=1 Tax=Chenopodium quinoa TaxID=63459 RepID=UPI000B7799E0|nr:dentin sialophosphoprotein-like [Chenopodium quinoa]